jgi:hypothetical protein
MAAQKKYPDELWDALWSPPGRQARGTNRCRLLANSESSLRRMQPWSEGPEELRATPTVHP